MLPLGALERGLWLSGRHASEQVLCGGRARNPEFSAQLGLPVVHRRVICQKLARRTCVDCHARRGSARVIGWLRQGWPHLSTSGETLACEAMGSRPLSPPALEAPVGGATGAMSQRRVDARGRVSRADEEKRGPAPKADSLW